MASRRLELPAQAPFRLDLTAWALRRRPQNAIDDWDGCTYRRALLVAGRPIALAVTQHGSAESPRIDVAMTGARLGRAAEPAVSHALRRLLGLEVDLTQFYARAARDSALAPLAQRYRGLKPPRFTTLFECLLNAVACQQLSLDAGLTMLSRLAAAASQSSEVSPFPDPEDVLRLPVPRLRELGFSHRKVQTILELGSAAATGELDADRFEPLSDRDVISTLVGRPGIGRWSADYVLLRGLGRLHVFPGTDVGALNGLRSFLTASGLDPDPDRALERWRDVAGMLYFHLLLRGLEDRGVLAPAP